MTLVTFYMSLCNVQCAVCRLQCAGLSFVPVPLLAAQRELNVRPPLFMAQYGAKILYGPNPVFVQVLFRGFRKNLKPDFNRP